LVPFFRSARENETVDLTPGPETRFADFSIPSQLWPFGKKFFDRSPKTLLVPREGRRAFTPAPLASARWFREWVRADTFHAPD
tara:strand:- start:24 stop:272 length:249 start_codon:yes stop_codon:yes gene_type:complete